MICTVEPESQPPADSLERIFLRNSHLGPETPKQYTQDFHFGLRSAQYNPNRLDCDQVFGGAGGAGGASLEAVPVPMALPLQFQSGDSAASQKLTGKEVFHVEGVRHSLNGGGRKATVRAVGADGSEKTFAVDVRVDTPQEVEYYRNGGTLPYVLRQLAK
jgi:hypothetical protein